MPATTTPATLPDEAKLREAIESLCAAEEAVAHLNWAVSAVAKVDPDEEISGAPPQGHTPTLEEIGRLFSFVLGASSRLEEIQDYVSGIKANLEELDYARIIRSGKDERALAGRSA